MGDLSKRPENYMTHRYEERNRRMDVLKLFFASSV